MNLRYSAPAVRDLMRLHEFIAENNPAAAKRYSQQLLKQVKSLVLQPLQGQALDAEPSVRELVARNYIIRYEIKENELIILKRWHGKELR
jgi:toxin ParE1/3/4